MTYEKVTVLSTLGKEISQPLQNLQIIWLILDTNVRQILMVKIK